MKKVLTSVVALALLFAIAVAWTRAAEKAAAQEGLLRHVVLFKFKDGTDPAKVKEIEDAFRALPGKIPTVIGFECGTNCSPEKLDQGFTHCFLVTFRDEAGRAVYLPHPAHKAFVEVLKPHLDKALVIDFVGKGAL
jgi:hypothetical protein